LIIRPESSLHAVRAANNEGAVHRRRLAVALSSLIGGVE
jgi:hypothetical protein